MPDGLSPWIVAEMAKARLAIFGDRLLSNTSPIFTFDHTIGLDLFFVLPPGRSGDAAGFLGRVIISVGRRLELISATCAS